MILTGARKSEIGDLRRSEINFERRQIELSGDRTKGGLDHIIPLSEPALRILQARQPRPNNEHVFGRAQGGFNGWSKSKERLDAKLDLEPWRLHDFRRSLSTTLHEKDIAPHIVESLLGHVSGHRAGVAGVYNRASYAEEKREALKLWGSHVMLLVEGR